MNLHIFHAYLGPLLVNPIGKSLKKNSFWPRAIELQP